MSPNTYALPVGVYGQGIHNVVMDEIELGERVTRFLDDENNSPEFWSLAFLMGEW